MKDESLYSEEEKREEIDSIEEDEFYLIY